jgi:hypothetical protein
METEKFLMRIVELLMFAETPSFWRFILTIHYITNKDSVVPHRKRCL